MRTKKILSLVVVILTITLLIPIIFILTINPNTLKPTLEQELAKQGIFLQLEGDIHWQFWPHLNLNLSKAALFENANYSGPPLASVDSATLRVDLPPLLKKKLRVIALNTEGLALRYNVDSNGISNWDFLTRNKTTQNTESTTSPPTDNTTTLAIDSISMKNNRIYVDLGDNAIHSAAIDELKLSNVNLQGEPILLHSDGEISAHQLPPIRYQLRHTLVADQILKVLSLRDIKFKASGSKRGELTLTGNAMIPLESGETKAKLVLSAPSLRDWLDMVDRSIGEGVPLDYLRNIHADITISSAASGAVDTKVDITVDDTLVAIDINMTQAPNDTSLPPLRIKIDGTRMNIDNYTFPVKTGTQQHASSAKPSSELPIELLNKLDLDVQFAFDEVIINTLPITHITGKLIAKKGKLKLDNTHAQIKEGEINTNAIFDARGKTAKLHYDVTFSELDLGFLGETLAELDTVQGKMQGGISGVSKGNSSEALTKNAQTAAQIRSNTLFLQPMNLVKHYCEAAAIIAGKEKPLRHWDKQTHIRNISLSANIDTHTATLKGFTGNIENLVSTATGSFDISSGKFDFPIKLSLQQLSSELQACNSIDQEWLSKELPLRCKGSLDDIGVKTCLPDLKYIEQLARERLDRKIDKEEKKIKDKVDIKKEALENKLEAKAKRLLDKHIDDNTVNTLKNLLKK